MSSNDSHIVHPLCRQKYDFVIVLVSDPWVQLYSRLGSLFPAPRNNDPLNVVRGAHILALATQASTGLRQHINRHLPIYWRQGIIGISVEPVLSRDTSAPQFVVSGAWQSDVFQDVLETASKQGMHAQGERTKYENVFLPGYDRFYSFVDDAPIINPSTLEELQNSPHSFAFVGIRLITTYQRDLMAHESEVVSMAREFFTAISFLDSEGWFPRTLLQSMFERQTTRETQIQEEAINWLIQRGLLWSNHDGTWLSRQTNHPSVGLWEYRADDKRHNARKTIEYALVSLIQAEYWVKDRPNLKHLVPHLQRLTDVAAQERDTNTYDLYIILGNNFDNIGQPEIARKYYEAIVKYHRDHDDVTSLDFANHIKKLANLCHQMGDLEIARVLYEEALAVERTVYGDSSGSLGMTLCELGQIARDQGDIAAALDYHNKCINAFQEIPEHPARAVSMNTIGDILLERGDYTGARTHYERSLEIGIRLEGREGGAAALVLHKLGLVHLRQNDYAQARRLLERAYNIRAEILGEFDRHTIETLTVLVTVCDAQGDLVSARRYLEQALNSSEAVHGATHPHTEELRTMFKHISA